VGEEKVITLKELDTYLNFAIEDVTGDSQIPATNVQAGFKDFGFVRISTASFWIVRISTTSFRI